MTARIECSRVVKTLASGNKSLTVLDRIDLVIEPTEFTCILGPSGSGKSTLLGLMAGLDRPTSGSIQLDGQALEDMNEDQLALLRRAKVGFVFQSFQLLGNLTARENVLLPMELNGVQGAAERTDKLLAEVGLSERGHHYPTQLSGGEQQRVALARAFAPQPAILFADEPTGNLDSDTGAGILTLMAKLREEHGTTLVLVTHDAHVAELADRCIHLRKGRVELDTANNSEQIESATT